MRSFFGHLGRYKLKLAIVVSIFAVSNVLLAVMPLYIGKLIGALASGSGQHHQAIVYAVILVICSSGHNLTWRAAELLYTKLLLPVGYQYENILFASVINKPYPYFVDKFTGKIASYVTTISQESRDLVQNLCFNYTGSGVSILVIGVILGSLNWQTAAIFVSGIIGMLLTGRYTIRKSTTAEQHAADVQSTKNGKLVDAISNFINIKSFQKESTEIATIKREQELTIVASKKSFFWGSIFWGSLSLYVRDFIWPAAIGVNVYLYLHGQLSLSQLATLLTTILLFSNVIWEVIWYISQFNLKLARTEEAHRYLFGKTKIDLDPPSRTVNHPGFSDKLELRHLSFAYPDSPDTPVLKDINITVPRGSKIGIVGKSGSGKSTLTNLLLGYYPSEHGQLALDGQIIASEQLASLISYVPQDTSLFHRSIAENIAYAAGGKLDKQAVKAAAKRAHAHEFISTIDEGYDALVGERGVKLSVGQRQRISIARALLDDKPILILDEATSALDSESEVLVQEGLEALWAEKTVIAIAHRLSTLRHMDEIIVMGKGKILERGNHQALIAQNGTYAKLWKHQSGGFLEE